MTYFNGKPNQYKQISSPKVQLSSKRFFNLIGDNQNMEASFFSTYFPQKNKIFIAMLALFILLASVACQVDNNTATEDSLVYVTLTPTIDYQKQTVTSKYPGEGTAFSIYNPISDTTYQEKLQATTPTATDEPFSVASPVASPTIQPTGGTNDTISNPTATPTATTTPQQDNNTPTATVPTTATIQPTATLPPTTGTTVTLGSKVVEPPNCTAPITIDLQVSDVSNLQGIAFKLQFDPSLVQVVDADPNKAGIQITLGSALARHNNFVAVNDVDQTNGLIDFAAVIIGQNSINGDAILAQITWTAQKAGQAALHLQPMELAGVGGVPIQAAVSDGTIEIEAGCGG